MSKKATPGTSSATVAVPTPSPSVDVRYAQRVRNRADSLADFHSSYGASVPEFSYLINMVDNELHRAHEEDMTAAIGRVIERLQELYTEFSRQLTDLCRVLPDSDELGPQIFLLERKMSVVFAVAAGLRGRENIEDTMRVTPAHL